METKAMILCMASSRGVQVVSSESSKLNSAVHLLILLYPCLKTSQYHVLAPGPFLSRDIYSHPSRSSTQAHHGSVNYGDPAPPSSSDKKRSKKKDRKSSKTSKKKKQNDVLSGVGSQFDE
ncbi:hypothetical protein PG993_002291 [Apiospora rasikravindrae]|uniref:Uncharacterized protein n=1 Tax=Apiospora rasikravindrae TaxID=990691 RepID=A0ABR1TW80_9PEZI